MTYTNTLLSTLTHSANFSFDSELFHTLFTQHHHQPAFVVLDGTVRIHVERKQKIPTTSTPTPSSPAPLTARSTPIRGDKPTTGGGHNGTASTTTPGTHTKHTHYGLAMNATTTPTQSKNDGTGDTQINILTR